MAANLANLYCDKSSASTSDVCTFPITSPWGSTPSRPGKLKRVEIRGTERWVGEERMWNGREVGWGGGEVGWGGGEVG